LVLVILRAGRPHHNIAPSSGGHPSYLQSHRIARGKARVQIRLLKKITFSDGSWSMCRRDASTTKGR